jgi:hypothetical protein
VEILPGVNMDPSNDEQVIAAGIWEARAEDTEMADDIARMIASRFHSGQGSAFYSFVFHCSRFSWTPSRQG